MTITTPKSTGTHAASACVTPRWEKGRDVNRALRAVVLALIAAWQHPVSAQPSTSVEASTVAVAFDDRTLDGHTFLFPVLQEGAFNTTHFGIRQGVAVILIPRLPIGAAGT